MGPIIRAQNSSQLELNIKKSEYNELRAIVLENELWFAVSEDMIHWDMARFLEDKLDLKSSVGVFLYFDKKDSRLTACPADYGNWNIHNLEKFPIMKRLRLHVEFDSRGRYRRRTASNDYD